MAERNATLTWANSAAVNTPQSAAIDVVDHGDIGETAIHVHNPSAVTALTVKPSVRWTDGGGTVRTSELSGESFSVPAGKTVSRVIKGRGVGDAGQLVVVASNDTVLGLADTFTAQVGVDFW